MSSPATFPRTFINMSASSPIDLTRTPRTPDIIIISESEDENEPSHNRNNSNYLFNENNNSNNTLGYDNQIIFNSLRHSSNNIQDSSSSNTNYNLRSGLGTNGSSPNRNTSRRPRVNFLLNVVSAFHPYDSTEFLFTSNDVHYGNNNSSGSSRPTLFDSTRANTNINSNDIQMLNTPPRRRTNNSPKPTTLSGHARDLNEFHTLICAECDELLHEKLWALSSCGHVVCGSCVDKYKYSEKKKFPCPSCSKTVNPKNILPLFV